LDLVVAWRPQLTEQLGGFISVGGYNLLNEQYDGFGANFSGARFVNPATERTWRVTLGATVSM
jgi:outer membrane receptor protein involved in Fe transport